MRVDVLDWSKRSWGQPCPSLTPDGNPLVQVALNGHVEALAAIVSALRRVISLHNHCNEGGKGPRPIQLDSELKNDTALRNACAKSLALLCGKESTNTRDLTASSQSQSLASVWFLNHHALAMAGCSASEPDLDVLTAAMATANKIAKELEAAELAEAAKGAGAGGAGKVKVVEVVDAADDEDNESHDSTDESNTAASQIDCPEVRRQLALVAGAHVHALYLTK